MKVETTLTLAGRSAKAKTKKVEVERQHVCDYPGSDANATISGVVDVFSGTIHTYVDVVINEYWAAAQVDEAGKVVDVTMTLRVAVTGVHQDTSKKVAKSATASLQVPASTPDELRTMLNASSINMAYDTLRAAVDDFRIDAAVSAPARV